jgi:hypothetical protein
MVSNCLGRRCRKDIKALARAAPTLVATNFALPHKRGKQANGEFGPRGFIGNFGHRNRRQGRSWQRGWGPYAPKRGNEEQHAELFKAAQRLTAAMADADRKYNLKEQSDLEAKVARIVRNPGMPKDVGQLLDKRYIVCTVGWGAGNPQHTDPHDFGGGLFTKIGEGPCLFALPEFEVYVRANDGDVLYINTPAVMHGACVPPDAAHAKRNELPWDTKDKWQVSKFKAGRQEHLTFGVYTRR